MRKLRLTAQQFDHFVFPYVAQAAAKNDGEFETALRLIRKLKDGALTEEIPLSEEESKIQANGKLVLPFRRLREGEATFVLEEDEWKMLRSRVAERKVNVSIVALEMYADLLATIDQAPEYRPEEVAPAAG